MAASFIADELVDMRGGVVSLHTGREITVGALQLQRRHGAGAAEGEQAGARWLGDGAA